MLEYSLREAPIVFQSCLNVLALFFRRRQECTGRRVVVQLKSRPALTSNVSKAKLGWWRRFLFLVIFSVFSNALDTGSSTATFVGTLYPVCTRTLVPALYASNSSAWAYTWSADFPHSRELRKAQDRMVFPSGLNWQWSLTFVTSEIVRDMYEVERVGETVAVGLEYISKITLVVCVKMRDHRHLEYHEKIVTVYCASCKAGETWVMRLGGLGKSSLLSVQSTSLALSDCW
jgi:hypothetical protein